MAVREPGRVVYSTAAGRVCPDCGWPASDCRCGTRASDEPVPVRIVAKVRIEKAGRGGKSVSVVDGLPRNAVFLKALCQELKAACGTGGTVRDGAIELQGELRARLRELLTAKGFGVKG
jgi:translation initiation factor 1